VQELDLGDADTDIVTVDDLSVSQLSGLAPTLKRLSLSRCRWVSSCEPLKGLTRLEALNLSHTDVGPKALEALAELPGLKALRLTGCRWECWVVVRIALGGQGSGYCNAGSCGMGGLLDPSAVDRCCGREHERSDSAEIIQQNAQHMQCANSEPLQWALLSGCVLCCHVYRNVTDEALLQLPKFPALTSLVLRSTLATNDGLKPLADMQCLEQLDLGSKCELNDAGRSNGQQQSGCPAAGRMQFGDWTACTAFSRHDACNSMAVGGSCGTWLIV
jgi:hypothetical protein